MDLRRLKVLVKSKPEHSCISSEAPYISLRLLYGCDSSWMKEKNIPTFGAIILIYLLFETQQNEPVQTINFPDTLNNN